jgi:hypothetical protein
MVKEIYGPSELANEILRYFMSCWVGGFVVDLSKSQCRAETLNVLLSQMTANKE